MLDEKRRLCYILKAVFCGRMPESGLKQAKTARECLFAEEQIGGGEVRVRITLECTECHHRNYNLTKEKKNHPERMETKKYCPFCQKHTNHKETK